MTVSYFTKQDNRRLAYVHSPACGEGKNLPAVLFLGGFKSDMTGRKVSYLEGRCRARGQEFVRFDYSGHGRSDGAFIDGTIGCWTEDARSILEHVIGRDVVLVGSSMGGWIGLLLIKEKVKHIKAMIGVAAAPDFTKVVEACMTEAQRAELSQTGQIVVPNEYADEPYIFTQKLLDNGRTLCLLDNALDVDVPVTLIQGKRDADVSWKKALKIQDILQGTAAEVVFIDDGDHRLSREQDLNLLDGVIYRVSGLL